MALWRKRRTAQLPSWSKKEPPGRSRMRVRLPQVKAPSDGPGLLFILVALVVVGVAGARLFGFGPEFQDSGRLVLNDPPVGVGMGEEEEAQVPVAASGQEDPRRIIIYHAHGSENYHPQPPHSGGGKAGDIVRVGAALAAALREQGFQVEHLDEVFDQPEWSQSFPRSGEAVAGTLERFDDVLAVIDIHRDAIAGDVPDSATTAQIGEQEAAKVLLVVGEADNPYADRNVAFAEALKGGLEQAIPDLSRGIRLHTNNYNGHLHPRSLQLFIGDYERNTVAQAQAAARLLAPVLAEMLKDE